MVGLWARSPDSGSFPGERLRIPVYQWRGNPSEAGSEPIFSVKNQNAAPFRHGRMAGDRPGKMLFSTCLPPQLLVLASEFQLKGSGAPCIRNLKWAEMVRQRRRTSPKGGTASSYHMGDHFTNRICEFLLNFLGRFPMGKQMAADPMGKGGGGKKVPEECHGEIF